MPAKRIRDLRRRPKKWRIQDACLQSRGVTTWPWMRREKDRAQKRVPGLLIGKIGATGA